MKTIWLLTLSTFISGCSTLSYKEPDSGPRAKVRFTTNSYQVTTLDQFENLSCEEKSEIMRLRNGPLLLAEPKRLGMPLWSHHDNGAKEVYVKAGVPFVGLFRNSEVEGISITSVVPGISTKEITFSKCGVPFKYTFRDKGAYEVAYNHGKCSVSIALIEKSDDGQFKMVPQLFEPLEVVRCAEAAKERQLY